MVPANGMERDRGLEDFTINFSTYEGLKQLLDLSCGANGGFLLDVRL